MKIAVFSDIHANLEALERALEDAAREGADRVVCLGDIVGYGPLPAETLARVRETCAVTVAGNHDDAVSGRGDASAFIDLAGDAVKRHRAALDEESLAWLQALPYTARLGGALLVHGDAVDPAAFNYIESPDDARLNFGATDDQLVFVGHTHVPGLFLVGHSGTIYKTEPQDFVLEPGKRYIVNPGSVGYPREADGKCLSSYVIYDTEEKSVVFRFLPFSVASVMQRGTAARRIKTRVIVALLAAVALVAGGLAFLVKKEKRVVETQTLVETVEIDKAAARVLETRALELESGTDAIRANLTLAKGSDPVELTVRFLDGDDKELKLDRKTVRQKSTGKMDVPKGARRAELTVSRLSDGGKVKVESFSPRGDRRTGS